MTLPVNTLPAALSPQTWPFELALLPTSAYLVGGSVRDVLLERQADYLDLDFVLPEAAIETAQLIAKHYQVGFVVLDAHHKIARVVFPQATVDFAQQVGPSLETDLRRRDFTVNAIAYHPHTRQLIDPLQGGQDLKKRLLRMISMDNLAADPLRLLRAYRQAAQLDFRVEPQTQVAIRRLADLLTQVAAERVRGELDALLSKPAGTAQLKACCQDRLLQGWLPQITADSLQTVAAIDQAYSDLQTHWPGYASLVTGWFKEQSVPGMHRSWLKAAKLSQLLTLDEAIAEAELIHLKYSRAEQQVVLATLRNQTRLTPLQVRSLSIREQYDLFRDTSQSFLSLSILALALQYPAERVYALIQRFLNPADPVAHPTTLISGRTLMQKLQLRPGRHIGQLLESIQLAHAEGKVTNAAEALDWAQLAIQHQEISVSKNYGLRRDR
ncbi:CCA tRNA nucleotidyltransferase [Almyronema epifaneia]|uniref:CCA tRNA nucleotidyltransferase n=1 Tax=Almyronema epifaneia S1 TaxID=2991925 RepID=A0ABW6IE01_9CYAN